MKIMNNYTIYCTPEQTKKAFKLGAPLHVIEATEEPQIKAINIIANGRHKEEYTLVDNMLINNPTAEQLVSWLELEENGFNFELTRDYAILEHDKIGTMGMYEMPRKESALVAIDCALEYLANNNLIK